MSPSNALKILEELQAELIDLGLEPGFEKRGEENGLIVFANASRVDVLNALNASGWEPVTDEGKESVLFKRKIPSSTKQEDIP